MKKILIILSLFFLSSSYTPPSCSSTSSPKGETECLFNRKALNDENDCCFVNFTFKYYEHDIPIKICEEVPKNKELKDYAKKREEEYKKNNGNIIIYKEIICKMRSLTIE